MKNIFLLIIMGLFSINSNSQLQKAKKFAKTITADDKAIAAITFFESIIL